MDNGEWVIFFFGEKDRIEILKLIFDGNGNGIFLMNKLYNFLLIFLFNDSPLYHITKMIH